MEIKRSANADDYDAKLQVQVTKVQNYGALIDVRLVEVSRLALGRLLDGVVERWLESGGVNNHSLANLALQTAGLAAVTLQAEELDLDFLWIGFLVCDSSAWATFHWLHGEAQLLSVLQGLGALDWAVLASVLLVLLAALPHLSAFFRRVIFLVVEVVAVVDRLLLLLAELEFVAVALLVEFVVLLLVAFLILQGVRFVKVLQVLGASLTVRHAEFILLFVRVVSAKSAVQVLVSAGDLDLDLLSIKANSDSAFLDIDLVAGCLNTLLLQTFLAVNLLAVDLDNHTVGLAFQLDSGFRSDDLDLLDALVGFLHQDNKSWLFTAAVFSQNRPALRKWSTIADTIEGADTAVIGTAFRRLAVRLNQLRE